MVKTESKRLYELVQKAALGDLLAFQDIYNLKWKEVYFVALSMMSDTSSAQDVAQEVFIKVYKNIGTLKKPESFTVWLYTIVRHVVADMHGRKNAVLCYSAEEINEYGQTLTEEQEEFLPQDFLERNENKKILFDALKELREDYRIVILLFYYKQMSIREIAAVTGSTISAVKVRLMRARNFMKEALEKLMRKGVVLYSVPAIPILTVVLHGMANQMVPEGMKAASWGQLSTNLATSSGSLASPAPCAPIASAKAALVWKIGIVLFTAVTCTGVVLAAGRYSPPPVEPGPISSLDIGRDSASVPMTDGIEIPLMTSSDIPSSLPDSPPKSVATSAAEENTAASAEPRVPSSAAPSPTSSRPDASPSSRPTASEMVYPDDTLEGILGYDNARTFLRYLQNASYGSAGKFADMTSRFNLNGEETFIENIFDERLKKDRYILYSKEKGAYILYICEYIRPSNQTYDIQYRIQRRSDPPLSWESWRFHNK